MVLFAPMTDDELEKAVNEKLITTKRAAEIIGFAHVESVIKPIKLGKLKAFFFDDTYWLVFREDAIAYKEKRKKSGDPKSKDPN